MDKDLTDLVIKVTTLTATVESWMGQGIEFRKHSCSKLESIDKKVDDVNMKIAGLPCPVQQQKIMNMEKNINGLTAIFWTVSIGVIVSGIVLGVWMKNIK